MFDFICVPDLLYFKNHLQSNKPILYLYFYWIYYDAGLSYFFENVGAGKGFSPLMGIPLPLSHMEAPLLLVI